MCRWLVKLRAWADKDLMPGPAPAIGMSIGAAFNIGLLLLGFEWWLRLFAVLLLACAGRFTPLFGRKMEGWHLEVAAGAALAEWVSWFKCKGPCR
jgi:hypothetical protein